MQRRLTYCLVSIVRLFSKEIRVGLAWSMLCSNIEYVQFSCCDLKSKKLAMQIYEVRSSQLCGH